MADIDKYRCQHGELAACQYCWAERFRNKWKQPEFQKKLQELREKETAGRGE